MRFERGKIYTAVAAHGFLPLCHDANLVSMEPWQRGYVVPPTLRYGDVFMVVDVIHVDAATPDIVRVLGDGFQGWTSSLMLSFLKVEEAKP